MKKTAGIENLTKNIIFVLMVYMAETLPSPDTRGDAGARTAAAAALLAATAAYGVSYFTEFALRGEGCPFLCGGGGKIGGILPCPLHGDGLTSA